MNKLTSALIVAFFSFAGVLLQLIANIVKLEPNQFATFFERFFSYFTILTNLLCGWYMWQQYKAKPIAKFWLQPAIGTAITVYILVVGLIYQVLLRGLVKMTGLAILADTLLHTITPAAMLFYWIVYTSSKRISWRVLPLWMIYPFIYLVYTLLHGNARNWYPYPFVDVSKWGMTKVLINSSFVLLLFLLLSVTLLGIAHFRSTKNSVSHD